MGGMLSANWFGTIPGPRATLCNEGKENRDDSANELRDNIHCDVDRRYLRASGDKRPERDIKGLIFSRKLATFHRFSPKASPHRMPRQCFPGRFPVFGSTFRLKNQKLPATPNPPLEPIYQANTSRG